MKIGNIYSSRITGERYILVSIDGYNVDLKNIDPDTSLSSQCIHFANLQSFNLIAEGTGDDIYPNRKREHKRKSVS